MGSVLKWGANVGLFLLGCFLAAKTANAVLSSLLAPPPVEVRAEAPQPDLRPRGWDDRVIILDRNLFNSSTLAPPAPAQVEEDLQRTGLPLRLLGTAASPDIAVARAAIEETASRTTLVVRVGDRILDKATVLRIDRRRVVLAENDARRELSLDDEANQKPRRVTSRSRRNTASSRAAARRRPRADSRQARVQRLAENRFEVSRAAVEETLRNPANLFSQARILPKYEEGQMVGMQIGAIKGGSLFEEIGLQDGDLITELNGIAVTSPEESAKLMQEFREANSFSVVVEGEGGAVRNLEFEMPEEE